MSFQTSCMVLVNDERQQIELENWMMGIGRRVLDRRESWHNYLLADTDGICFWLQLDESDRGLFDQDFYDCGENIELFKALAAINDENDREQWFIAQGVTNSNRLKDTVETELGGGMIWGDDWFKVLIPLANDISAKWMTATPAQPYRKATREEIIEHYSENHVRQQK